MAAASGSADASQPGGSFAGTLVGTGAVSASADASPLGGSYVALWVLSYGRDFYSEDHALLLLRMHSCAEAASADASQLGGSQQGGSSAGTVVGTVCVLRIGSFNAGIDQNMLQGKRAGKYISKVEDIITTYVPD